MSDTQDDEWFADYDMQDETAFAVELHKQGSHFEGPKLTRGFSFTLVEDREIETKQSKMIDEIKDTLGVNDTIARALLLKLHWDKNKLMQAIADNEKVIQELFNLGTDQNMSDPNNLCPVCYENSDNMFSMECGHSLCKECYH